MTEESTLEFRALADSIVVEAQHFDVYCSLCGRYVVEMLSKATVANLIAFAKQHSALCSKKLSELRDEPLCGMCSHPQHYGACGSSGSVCSCQAGLKDEPVLCEMCSHPQHQGICRENRTGTICHCLWGRIKAARAQG